jgi:hypothetical protein
VPTISAGLLLDFVFPRTEAWRKDLQRTNPAFQARDCI